MRYPVKCNWISYKPSAEDEDMYIVNNHLLEEEYHIDGDDIRFIEKLDGKTDPMKLIDTMSKRQMKIYLMYLEHMDLIRTSRFVIAEFPTYMWTVCSVKDNLKYKSICEDLNILLVLSVIPTAMLAVVMLMLNSNIKSALDNTSLIALIIGFVFGIISGFILHELGHAISCTAYGGMVFEFGLAYQGSFAAYTLLDTKQVKKRLHRIQIDMSGIEVNILLAAVYVILFCLCSNLKFANSYFWLQAAISNISLAGVNVLMVDGFDGMGAVKEILGLDNLMRSSAKALYNKKRRSHLLESEAGTVKVMAVVFIELSRFIYPLIIVLSVILIWT